MDLNGEDMDWLIQSSNFVEVAAPVGDDFGKEVSSFLRVLKTFFKSDPKLVDDTAFGVVSSETDVHGLLRTLKVLGYFFAVRNSHVNKKNADTKLLWDGRSDKTTRHPYIVDKLVRYNCSVGRILKRQLQGPVGNRGTSCCPAVMTLRRVSIFTSVKTPVNKQRRLELRRTICALLADGNARTEEEFWVWLPLPKRHNHPIRPAVTSEGRWLDSEVKAAMFDVIGDEPMTVEQVKEKLYEIVHKEFAHSNVKPSAENSVFFPTDKETIETELESLRGVTPMRDLPPGTYPIADVILDRDNVSISVHRPEGLDLVEAPPRYHTFLREKFRCATDVGCSLELRVVASALQLSVYAVIESGHLQSFTK